MTSRRRFLAQTATLAAGMVASPAVGFASDGTTTFRATDTASLCGEWLFRTDEKNVGIRQEWFQTENPLGDWHKVTVPHTWQVDSRFADYRGVAWYRRVFDASEQWAGSVVRIEFEAVLHTATVWVNGHSAGEHVRKGYTAFTLDISRLLHLGRRNTIAVCVDNSFDQHMLPRGRQSDWAHDGGIFRPVQLLVTPQTFVEQVDVEALPDLTTGNARLAIAAHCRNASSGLFAGRASFRVVDDASGLEVLAAPDAATLSIPPGATETLTLHATLPKAKLWSFDHPNLYRLEFSIADPREAHSVATTFGVRKFEVKDGKVFLNGEPVRLMGVERMAGSNPEFGMAELDDWIVHDHNDLKDLNCAFTRVHWPQDRRVLDYCDRHGILMQSEVPAWGPQTFDGMSAEPDANILQNGLEQLREMIARDRNHPSIVVWGLCNEIGGQNPPAYQFARQMLAEAKKLDPNRLCAYASDSLRETPERDVAGLTDIIETNEYFGTWYPGTAQSLTQHLDDLHRTFPGKPIVVSEYGYCACTPDRPEDDTRRVEILQTHTAAIRSSEFVAGAIFFCYNDYRTHVGDRGVGALQQRVHGVVDLFGHHKPSYDVLRAESSPILSLAIDNRGNNFHVQVKTRGDFPRYTLKSYRLRAIFYGEGDIPVEQQEVELPEIAPGGQASIEITFR